MKIQTRLILFFYSITSFIDPVQSILQPSFVVAYVPSWLKFSYLSELLVCIVHLPLKFQANFSLNLQEASLADISYLFEQGALVDFQVNELVNLVRALFADTSLRTNTINKLLNGHPVAPQ